MGRYHPAKFSTIFLIISFTMLIACSSNVGDDSSAEADQQNSSSAGSGLEDNPGYFTELKPGTQVGLFTVERPPANFCPFMAYGTMPIPPGGFPLPDGKLPFIVVDHDGTLLPTNNVGVARYSDQNDGFAVVELAAQVSCDSNVAVGDQQTHRILFSPFDGPTEPSTSKAAAYLDATPGLQSEVRTLFQQAGSLLLRAEDVDGNEYQIDLLKGEGNVHKVAFGPSIARVSTYGMMMLTKSGPGGSGCSKPPHLFGVHAYFEARSGEPFLKLDIKINNGQSNFDKSTNLDDPLGRFFVRSVELGVPNGYTVEQEPPDPSFDNQNVSSSSTHTFIKLIKERSDGKYIYFRARSQLNRRLAVVVNGQSARASEALKRQGIAFVTAGTNQDGDSLFHWSEALTPNFLASRMPTPSFDSATQSVFASKYAQDMSGLRGAIVSGTASYYPVFDNACDGRHPIMIDYGGQTGGELITLDGAEGVQIIEGGFRNGIRYSEMFYRMVSDRQQAAYYNTDGHPTSVDDWAEQGSGVVPYEWFNGIKPGYSAMGDLDVDTCQFDYVMNTSKQATCMNTLDKKDNLDHQHQIRWTLNIRNLAWLANDTMAKDEMRNAAEWSHHSDHQYFNPSYCGSSKGCTPGTLMSAQNITSSTPNKGLPWGRDTGWILDDFASGYTLSDDSAWRKEKLKALKIWSDVNAKAVTDCSPDINGGTIAWRGNDNKVLWKIAAAPPDGLGEPKDTVRAQQTWEEMIIEHAGQLSNLRSAIEGIDATAASALGLSIEKSSRFHSSDYAFSASGSTTADQIILGYNNGYASFQPWCKLSDVPSKYKPDYWWQSTQSGNFYSGRMFGAAYFITGDPYFLQRAAVSYGKSSPTDLLNSLLSSVKGDASYLQNRATLIAALQDYLGQ